MLEQFDTKTAEELSQTVRNLSNTVASLVSKVDQISSKLDTHQHGGADGTAQMYNENIRLKPGVYIQGGIISPGEGSTIEIKSGSITAQTSYHVIKGEGGAADFLDNVDLSNSVKGQILVLRIDPAATVTLRDGVGNLRLASDFTMTSSSDVIVLFHDKRFWYEITRSYNSFDYTGFTFVGDNSELTIASGAVTPYSGYHTIMGQGGAGVDDDLETINEPGSGLNDGAVLVLARSRDTTAIITVKNDVGNLRLESDFVMDDTDNRLTLLWTGSLWTEIARQKATSSGAFIVLGDETELTISSGAVTATTGYHTIDTEGNAGTDDLDTINVDSSVADGSILVICAESTSRDVVAKDGTGNLRLASDFTMTSSNSTLTLIWTGTVWREVARSAN